jgi:hypothetical protein
MMATDAPTMIADAEEVITAPLGEPMGLGLGVVLVVVVVVVEVEFISVWVSS